MKDSNGEIEYKGKKYKLVFNLNVMEKIQDEYETLDKWADLTSGKNQEVNIKALKFGFTEMINEGLEIEAEKNGTEFNPVKQSFIGRMLTDVGLEDMTNALQETIVESTKGDNSKNE